MEMGQGGHSMSEKSVYDPPDALSPSVSFQDKKLFKNTRIINPAGKFCGGCRLRACCANPRAAHEM